MILSSQSPEQAWGHSCTGMLMFPQYCKEGEQRVRRETRLQRVRWLE